jgi:hypothetical protein
MIFFLPGEEKSVRLATPFGLSAGFRPALHNVELNLTSADTPIYHSPGGDEAKLVLKRSSRHHNGKRNAYFYR